MLIVWYESNLISYIWKNIIERRNITERKNIIEKIA